MDPTQAIAWHDEDNEDDVHTKDTQKILATLTAQVKEEKTFGLSEGTHSIGRTADNDIVLPYPSISKKHATLEVSQSAHAVCYAFIVDLGSLNKTRLCRSDDEQGITLTPHTRYELLAGAKLIFGDVSCHLTVTAVPAPDPVPVSELLSASEPREVHIDAVASAQPRPALESTQAYEITDEELLADQHESRAVVPKRRASKWSEHAPVEGSETLGSVHTANESLKSESSTIWFRKEPREHDLASTQAYDDEATQGHDRTEGAALTQAYEEAHDKPNVNAATQGYDERASPARADNATLAYDEPHSADDDRATQAYEPSSPVKPLDQNATLAYEEPDSPVKGDNNVTQAYEEPASPVKPLDQHATQAYEVVSSPLGAIARTGPVSPVKAVDTNATQIYDEADSPKPVDNNATQAYEEPASPVKPLDQHATQAYEEPVSPSHEAKQDDNGTQAYEAPASPQRGMNATLAYEEPDSPEHMDLEPGNNATQAYDIPADEAPHNPVMANAPPGTPGGTHASEHHTAMEIDATHALPKDTDGDEVSNLFHESHSPLQDTTQHKSEPVRHSDSSDTQGPSAVSQKVTGATASHTATTLEGLDNDATLRIADSTEIKNESLDATLQLPATPPLNSSVDSLSDEAIESVPSDLWFIRHKDSEPRPSIEHKEHKSTHIDAGARPAVPVSSVPEHDQSPHAHVEPSEERKTPVKRRVNAPKDSAKSGAQHTPPKSGADEHTPPKPGAASVPEQPPDGVAQREEKSATKTRRHTLKKSLSPTRARTKIEPEDQEAPSSAASKPVSDPSDQAPQEAPQEAPPVAEQRSTRGRRKSLAEPSEDRAELKTPTKRNTRRTALNDAEQEHNQSVPLDSPEVTPVKSKRKLSQSVDDSPRETKRQKTSPEAKAVQSKPGRRKSGSDAPETAPVPHILFTGFAEDVLKKYAKVVEALGGHTVTDLQQLQHCTHLVTDSAQRTVKFLAALNCVQHVVTAKWIDKCHKQHAFVDAAPFVLRDHTAERKFDFALHTSLARAQQRKVFAGLQFVITAHTKPVPEDLKSIVLAAGGQCLKAVPKKADPSTVIIACAEDEDQAAALAAAGHRVFTPEFVLSSVIRQQIDFDQNLLPLNVAPDKENKGRKKK